ncbi:hypothetical protein B0H10DRAFT_2024520 [Mycena sp. CBHHK59/15]|nr:hypothetical protein B0H10DRAFT_2024520 [Mycena sp. CBHHK59/15]
MKCHSFASQLKSFAATNATSLTWTVDIAVSTAIILALKDSTGTIAYSDQYTILSGSDTSCVSSSTSASGSAGSTATAETTSTTGIVDTSTTATATTNNTGTATSTAASWLPAPFPLRKRVTSASLHRVLPPAARRAPRY